MPARSTEPLKKCTVDLFLDDVTYLRGYDANFTEFVREAVRERVRKLKLQSIDFAMKPAPFTIGDLEND